MKCYVYYKGGDMKEFKPLNPNYEPTSVLTRAAVVDDSPTIRKDLIDGTIEDNKGKAFVAMQLRSVDDGKVVYSRSTDESLQKKECSMQKAMEAYKSRKHEALEDESDEVKAMVKELAEETGNNYEDAALESYAPGKGICVTFGDEEYYCYEDYSDAEEASTESVKDLLEMEGVDFIHFENIGGIEQFIDVDWFKDAQREDAESYVSDIKESEPERYKEEFGDIDEEDAVEKCLEDWGDDYIQWFKDNFGDEEFNTAVKEHNLVDLDALAAACTEADGPANELARYDGKEIELPCGYYCYRSN
jgi:hypothetical protein